MKALVVDDSKVIRMAVSKILISLDFEVFEASNGREGVEKLEEIGKPDLVLVDWNMPEMNGHEFIVAVRQNDKYNDMPLMMVTTESEMDKVRIAVDSGANEFVMKPFTPEMIKSKMRILGLHDA